MSSISVNKFRDNLNFFVDQVFSEHAPLKVTRRKGDDFVVLSADDWGSNCINKSVSIVYCLML